MIATKETLGIGIYTPAEAAFYARVSPRLITRWVFGESKGKPVIERQLRESDEKVITFLDLVQSLAVREVRQRHGLPLQRIREGVDEARKRYGLEYPLACNHLIFLFGDQQSKGHGQMLIRLKDDQEGYVQLTGKSKGNYMITPVVEMFLDNLSFDPETKFATQYCPMVDKDDENTYILLDPHRRFGEPVVQPSGYTVEALWHATNTEGGMEAAAEAYDVPIRQVALANKYYDTLFVSEAA